MFTGDSSGDTLYAALHRAEFASQPASEHRDDGLTLNDTFVTAVARCAPPGNRPTAEELSSCRPFLAREWELMPQILVVVALGQVAFDGLLRMLRDHGYDVPRLKFGHGLCHPLVSAGKKDTKHLIASYHPSRQNTQTGRLTPDMLDDVFSLARSLMEVND
jgi:uracil-DNA glycosylase family 4